MTKKERLISLSEDLAAFSGRLQSVEANVADHEAQLDVISDVVLHAGPLGDRILAQSRLDNLTEQLQRVDDLVRQNITQDNRLNRIERECALEAALCNAVERIAKIERTSCSAAHLGNFVVESNARIDANVESLTQVVADIKRLDNSNAALVGRILSAEAGIADRVKVLDATIADLLHLRARIDAQAEVVGEAFGDQRTIGGRLSELETDVRQLRNSPSASVELRGQIAALDRDINHFGALATKIERKRGVDVDFLLDTAKKHDGELSDAAVEVSRTRSWLHGVENRVARLCRKVKTLGDRADFHDGLLYEHDKTLTTLATGIGALAGEVGTVRTELREFIDVLHSLNTDHGRLQERVDFHIAGEIQAKLDGVSVNYGSINVEIDGSRVKNVDAIDALIRQAGRDLMAREGIAPARAIAAPDADCPCETMDQCDGSCATYENMMRDMYDPDAPINQLPYPIDLSVIRLNRELSQDVPLRNAAATLRDDLDEHYRSAINDGLSAQSGLERAALRAKQLQEIVQAAYADVLDAAMSSGSYANNAEGAQ